MIIISKYRPPDTSISEWNSALTSLVNDINLCQANGSYERVIFGGDINFNDLTWNQNGTITIDNNLNGQKLKFADLCGKLSLCNLVDKPTRGNNILDVVMTNDSDIYRNCEVELNSNFSDHNLVKIRLTFNVNDKCEYTENLEYPSEITNYNWRFGNSDDWEKYKSLLEEHDWYTETCNMKTSEKLKYLHDIIEESVKKIFVKKG